MPRDRNDVAPRLVSTGAARESQTTIHAAYGIYYDNIISGAFGVADIVTGQLTACGRWSRGSRCQCPRGIHLADAFLSGALGAFPSLIISLDPNLQTSHAHQFSAGIDRAFGTWTVSAAAAYVRGLNQIGTIDYNPVLPDLDWGGVRRTSAESRARRPRSSSTRPTQARTAD